MEVTLAELSKLEKLTAPSSSFKAKSPSTSDTLSSLLQSLRQCKDLADSETLTAHTLDELARTVEGKKKALDDRQKEVYSSIARIGKAMDKKFPNPLPSYPNLFNSSSASSALERTIALHFLRTGQFEVAQTFLEESNVDIPDELRHHFVELHDILQALRERNIEPALAWVQANRGFLRARASPLEFHLHRSRFIQLLLHSYPPEVVPPIEYGRTFLAPFYAEHPAEFKRLMACLMYLPLSRLQMSPYADLASPSLHFDLEPLFTKEYCASLGMSKQVPLRTVCDIGGGGALAKIEKGRRVMRERKSEWSQADELPIEIPLPPENRYHSIFTCPVSKEQSTEDNPPMMMTCGHVISRDSLQKLAKLGRVKCPYCPVESQSSAAVQVYF